MAIHKHVILCVNLLCLLQVLHSFAGEQPTASKNTAPETSTGLQHNTEIDRKQGDELSTSKKISPEMVEQLKKRFKDHPHRGINMQPTYKEAVLHDQLFWAHRKIFLLEALLEEQTRYIQILEADNNILKKAASVATKLHQCIHR